MTEEKKKKKERGGEGGVKDGWEGDVAFSAGLRPRLSLEKRGKGKGRGMDVLSRPIGREKKVKRKNRR